MFAISPAKVIFTFVAFFIFLMISFQTGLRFIPCEIEAESGTMHGLCGVEDLIFEFVLKDDRNLVEKPMLLPLPFFVLTIVMIVGSYLASSVFVAFFQSVIKVVRHN